MKNPLTAAQLWAEIKDALPAETQAEFVVLGGEVWLADDVPQCEDCKVHSHHLESADNGAEVCADCNRRRWEDDAEVRSLNAWASHVRGV